MGALGCLFLRINRLHPQVPHQPLHTLLVDIGYRPTHHGGHEPITQKKMLCVEAVNFPHHRQISLAFTGWLLVGSRPVQIQ
jgi:hypothetical protein